MITITFDEIKEYYEKGWWTEENVALAVSKNKITSEEYKEIIGKNYSK